MSAEWINRGHCPFAGSHVLLLIVFLFFGIFSLKLTKTRNVRDYPRSEMVSLSGEQGQGVSHRFLCL